MMGDGMTKDEMITSIAQDYAVDENIVAQCARGRETYREIENAVADELERIIAIESGELDW